MIVGVPREVKDYENRVALVPRSVSSLTNAGIKVAVESRAGERSGFSDDEYSGSGAEIAKTPEELYAGSDLIVKVKEIQLTLKEDSYLKPKHTVFGFNHFESSRELTEAALRSGATFISFEKVVNDQGQTPLLMPMSRIAGTIAGIWAGFIHNFAFKHDRSVRLKAGSDQIRAKFIDGFDHIIGSQGAVNGDLKRTLSIQDRMVLIYGGGTVGEMAARVCSSLGAKIMIVEKKEARRKYLHDVNLPKSSILGSVDGDIIRGAHIIIGATYDKEKADRVIDEKTLKESSEVRKKIVIDVSVDQGGNFPYIDSSGQYSPSTMGTIMNPAQLDYFGNMFVRVPNIPSIVPRYASDQLSGILTDYVKEIAAGSPGPAIQNAVSIRAGQIIDEAVRKAHNMK